MIGHASMSNAAEMFARKLQATTLLAALARISLTGKRSPDDEAALEQGLALLDDLIEGRQLFSGERVTRRLVTEGMAFLAAARALNSDQREQLEEFGIYLKEIRTIVDAIKGQEQVSAEQGRKLEDFLTQFARILQSDINMIRGRRHVLSTSN